MPSETIATPTPASPSPTDEETASPSTASTEDGGGSDDTDDTGASPRPPVLSRDATGRSLTTADFFKTPDEWRDGRFNVAGQQQLSGVSGPLRNCEEEPSDSTTTIELRLANNFAKISFDFGQGDDSEDSDTVLYVQVTGNGGYIDQKSVPFNKIRTFEAPVSNVNALKIQMWLGGKVCDYNSRVVGVLTNLKLT
ncbi:hypothetical protein [uncultured Friedmanniella sp.]|uniref:hypothetical protein n=1 Tax=uncultured Friedmanniella sp. TaxID=335381 RepID=UPI0035CAADD3